MLRLSLDAQLDWWRRELEGAPVLALPTDAPRARSATVARCGWLDVEVEEGVVLALEALAVECGATMFMLLLGALQLLLCAHGATDDVVVRQGPSATMFALLSPPSRHARVDSLPTTCAVQCNVLWPPAMC